VTTPLRPWAAPEITAWKRLPMHAVPHRDGELGVERVLLDGTWRFRALPHPGGGARGGRERHPPQGRARRPRAWTLQEFDDVHGVGDLPHYTNVQMPWPGRPPHPPADRNPTGVHERDVEIPASWAGRRIVLHVGAAESVLLAAVNGVDVGIGKDSISRASSTSPTTCARVRATSSGSPS
jgi:beta-galactosidase